MPVTKLSHKVVFAIAKANADMAVAALDVDWAGIAQVDQDMWAAATIYGSDDVSGIEMFRGYFMGSFVADYNEITAYTSTVLGAGTDDTYANRATRTWTAT